MKFTPTTIEKLRKQAVEIGRYPNGDIDYYFDKEGREIGFVSFPGYNVERAFEVTGRKWHKGFRDNLEFTRVN